MKNTLKQLLERMNLSVPKFKALTGVGNQTAYNLVKQPDYIPDGVTIGKICEGLDVQPNDFLIYTRKKK